jgi:hypothetical protein
MNLRVLWLDAAKFETQRGGEEVNTRARAIWIRLWVRSQSRLVSSMVWSDSLELKVCFTRMGQNVKNREKRRDHLQFKSK